MGGQSHVAKATDSGLVIYYFACLLFYLYWTLCAYDTTFGRQVNIIKRARVCPLVSVFPARQSRYQHTYSHRMTE